MKVAALQMTSGIRVDANLATARRLLQIAAGAGAELAVLPENFAFMGRDEADKRAVAEVAGAGPIQDCIAGLAQELARHANIQTTTKYAHLSNNELDQGYYDIFEKDDS